MNTDTMQERKIQQHQEDTWMRQIMEDLAKDKAYRKAVEAEFLAMSKDFDINQ